MKKRSRKLKAKSFHIPYLRYIIFGVLGAAVSLSFIVAEFAWLRHIEKPPQKTLDQVSHTHSFAKYDFSIKFPGAVTSNDYTSPITSDTKSPPVPYTLYSSFLNNHQELFEVYAYNWPAQDADFADMTRANLKTSLKGSVNQDAAAMKGSVVKVVDKTNALYANSGMAEVAEIAIPKNGWTAYSFDDVFTVGNYQYDIITVDSGLSAFDWFTQSFKYTGPGNAIMYPNVPNLRSDYYDGSCSDSSPNCTPATDNDQAAGGNPQSSSPSSESPSINISN